jgi:hypothetical protein
MSTVDPAHLAKFQMNTEVEEHTKNNQEEEPQSLEEALTSL